MNTVLWVVQVLLALALVVVGATHATRRDRASGPMAWMLAVPRPLLTTIGVLEVLAAIGLVMPWATGILPWLTPLAAILVVVLMVLAADFHLRRPGETQNVAFNAVLAIAAAFIAIGRPGLVPFS